MLLPNKFKTFLRQRILTAHLSFCQAIALLERYVKIFSVGAGLEPQIRNLGFSITWYLILSIVSYYFSVHYIMSYMCPVFPDELIIYTSCNHSKYMFEYPLYLSLSVAAKELAESSLNTVLFRSIGRYAATV